MIPEGAILKICSEQVNVFAIQKRLGGVPKLAPDGHSDWMVLEKWKDGF